MRWPRPRFTVRRLMVAVAISGLLFGAGVWVARMRALSAEYRRISWEFQVSTAHSGSGSIRGDGYPVGIGEDENSLMLDAWSRKMARKYDHLSIYPWLTVEPDPPPPEPLPHPRHALELPNDVFDSLKNCDARAPSERAPAWTFLWTSARIW